MSYSLQYDGCKEQLKPYVFIDADWAEDASTPKSMSGSILIMGVAAVSWLAREKEVVTLSSTEAEYIATGLGVKETIWVRRLVKILDI